MDREALLWLAGLLEGEGCFMKGSPSRPNLPSVAVAMTDRDVIDRVAGILGVSVSTSHSGTRINYKPIFIARVVGSTATRLMIQLRPLMGIRRQAQIDAAMASYAVLPDPNHKLSPDDVRTIRRRAGAGERLRDIASDYGVDHSVIWRTKMRRIHRDVADEVD